MFLHQFVLLTFVDFSYTIVNRYNSLTDKKESLMGQIRVTDEIFNKLKEVSDGRSMSATIQKLLEDNSGEDVLKRIENRLIDIETTLKNIKIAKGAQNTRSARSADIKSIMQEADSYARSMWTKAPQVPQEPQKPDRTYSEVINEVSQLQEELKSLDDDSPRAKEIKNKIRADNAELALLDED